MHRPETYPKGTFAPARLDNRHAAAWNFWPLRWLATWAAVALPLVLSAQQTVPTMRHSYSLTGAVPPIQPVRQPLSLRLDLPNSSGFNILINPGPNLARNAPALAAFQRAANQWKKFIRDPVTIVISAELIPNTDPRNLGGADAVRFSTPFFGIRSNELGLAQVVKRDNLGGLYQATTDALPNTEEDLQFRLDSGDSLMKGPAPYGANGSATKANLKALGYPVAFLDTVTPGDTPQEKARDAYLEFNSNQPFDFDRSNGIPPGSIDFESIVAHEIGHALGFVSDVDIADYVHAVFEEVYFTAVPTTLDLFRFEEGTTFDPESLTEFTTFPRSFQTVVPANMDVIVPGPVTRGAERAFSTGSLDPAADGRQASHWKDDALTRDLIGLLDPTFSFGQAYVISNDDLLALDLIGWDVAYRSFLGFAGNPDDTGVEVVYDGTRQLNPDFFQTGILVQDGVAAGPFEFGDEVSLYGTARVLNEFVFHYFGDMGRNAIAMATLRFYANDRPFQDPITGKQLMAPGSLLWQSERFPLARGRVEARIPVPSIEVPDTFTFTIEVPGLAGVGGNRFGLYTTSSRAAVGTSYNDFWTKEPGGWTISNLRNNPGAPRADFAVRISADQSIELPTDRGIAAFDNTRALDSRTFHNGMTHVNATFQGPFEFGDELTIEGQSRVVNGFAFYYYGDALRLSTPLLTLRFYANDHPVVDPVTGKSLLAPGTLLWQSDPLTLIQGQVRVEVPVPNIVVPRTFTYSVEVPELTGQPGDQFGLFTTNEKADIGTSYNDFWEKTTTGWRVYNLGRTPTSTRSDFAAKVTVSRQTIPDPPLLYPLQLESRKLSLTWSGGRLEYSDAISGPWAEVINAISPVIIDTHEPNRFYRVRQ